MQMGHEERCVGCLLGAMCGDILGATPEGQHMNQSQIRALADGKMLRDFVAGPHLGMWKEGDRKGMYTDDTSSVLALACSLIHCKGLDPLEAARAYSEWWLLEPFRGYPETAEVVLVAVREGIDPSLTGRLSFASGSYANGAAMRIAPIGLAFRHATDQQLRSAVAHAVYSSHVHPEAIDAAAVLAKGIALATQHCLPHSASSPNKCSMPVFEPCTYLDVLIDFAKTEAMQSRLRFLRSRYSDGGNAWTQAVWSLDSELDNAPTHVQGPHDWFQIRAPCAVGCALWAFLSHWDQSPEEAIVAAVDLGGDADTVGSMTGALAGALHGQGRNLAMETDTPNDSGSAPPSCGSTATASVPCSWLPDRWWREMEDGPYGRRFVVRCAQELSSLDLREPLAAAPGAEAALRQLLRAASARPSGEAAALSAGPPAAVASEEEEDAAAAAAAAAHLEARRAWARVAAEQSVRLYRQQRKVAAIGSASFGRASD